MSQPAILVEAIGKPLKSAGFKKKADTWYLNNQETIAVLNLQKSSYGPQFYINIGVWLKPLGESDSPKIQLCQIGCRWESLIPLDYKHLACLLDLEDRSKPDEERSEEIGSLLRTYVLPFYSRIASLDNLRAYFNSDSWPKSCVPSAKARELLGGKNKGSSHLYSSHFAQAISNFSDPSWRDLCFINCESQ